MILNPDNQIFKRISTSKNSLYVDKSDFIAETFDFLNSDRCLMAFTRPRRFGKTVTASMLSAYYSKGCSSDELFSNLKIASHPDYKTHLNQHDVIYWDMNSIKGDFEAYSKRESLHIEDVDDLVDYLQYKTVLEVTTSSEFSSFFEQNPLTDNLSLTECLRSVHEAIGTTFVLIMDEWDLIYRDYKDDEALQEKFIDLLRVLFKGTEGLKCFSFVYLTGILPIKKYNSQSALNNFAEYNMLKPRPFERFFGFTCDEVKALVGKSKYPLSFDELEKWYDGYRLNDTEIFNPNSVILALKDGECNSYWYDTAAFDQVQLLLNMNFEGIKDDMLNMISSFAVKY